MSLTESTTTRRLSLLAGSSFLVAGILGAAMLAPTSAAAQVNACGDPSANLGAADELECPAGSYPTGINYSTTTNGDLTLILQNRVNTGTSNTAGTGPIIMYGKVDEDMTLVREDDPAGAGDPRIVNTAGRGIDMETRGDGSVLIDLTDGDPTSGESTSASTGTAPVRVVGGTDAIRAEAFGSGDVEVIFALTGAQSGTNHPRAVISANGGSGILARSTTGDITINTEGANLSVNSSNVAGSAGIDARSTGGDVSITTGGFISGRLYGIRAQTTGAGNLTIVANDSVSTANIAGDEAVIDARTGTGLLQITAGNIGNMAGNRTGSTLRIVTGGDAMLNMGAISGIGLVNPIVDMTTQSGSLTTLNHTQLGGSGSGQGVAGPSAYAIRAAGGDFLINSSSDVQGRVDFGDVTGDVTWNIGTQWRTALDSSFGSGNDTVSIAAGANFQAQARGTLLSGFPDEVEITTIDFGGGEDRLVNAGTWFIGARYANQAVDPDLDILESELSFLNLERFENSGAILFGEFFFATTMETDGITDDVLLMPGTTFVGGEGSVLFMDVNLNSAGQTACDPALRDSNFDMPGSDCLGLVDGATEGVTLIRVFDDSLNDRGAFNADGVVLVDVAGGTSEAGHFVLDPESPGYDPTVDGINKGLIFFPLVYDAETQQHKIISGLTGDALQYPVLAQAAHAVWRTATGTWLERQADLRGGMEEGVGGGVWIRGATETADRDLIQTTDLAGTAYDFDNTFNQNTYAVTIGLDAFSGHSGDSAYGLGVMGGYTHSEVDFEASPNRAQFDGWSLGVYASIIHGGLFVDAALNGNKLIMDHDVPSLGLLPAGAILSTSLASVGGQVDAGWRFPIMGRGFIEPLAGVSYVRSTFDDLRIVPDDASRPGIDIEFDDPTSLRANLGGRIGLDQDYGGWRAQYSVLGRVWNEFEDETSVVLHNIGDDAFATNEFTGTFSEFNVGVSLYGLDGAASGFLNIGGMFGDDYKSVKASAGVRVNW